LILYFAYGRRHSALARSRNGQAEEPAKGADGMVIKTLLMILCLVGMMAPMARGQQPPPPDAERLRKMVEIVNRPVVYSVPGMDQVTVRKDLVYTKSDDPNVKMDLYLPPGLKPGEKRPAVLFLHGGAPTQYRPKEWGFFQIPPLKDSVDRFVVESLVRGVPLTLLFHPDAPHAFDNQIDDDRTRKIVQETVESMQWLFSSIPTGHNWVVSVITPNCV
jgi:hypothetical protein